jgi:hypothetical protein
LAGAVIVPCAVAQSFSSVPVRAKTSQRQTACDLPAWMIWARAISVIADRRPQVVDLELRGDDPLSREGATAGIGQRVIGQIAEDATMDEAILLLEFMAHRQAEFGTPRLECGQFGTEHGAEGLFGEDAAAEGEKIGDLGHSSGLKKFCMAEYQF